MYQQAFGTIGQMRFNAPEDYYEFLGFLARNDRTTALAWEPNDQQGAWGQEGRIHFLVNQPAALQATLGQTAGRGNSIVSRVNCNEFVQHIIANHAFAIGTAQNTAAIRATVPTNYLVDFDRGLTMVI